MTGEELVTKFESIIDDSLDDTLTYQLLNMAKDEVEDERPWEFLKKLSEAASRSVGDTYQTTKTLPADFRLPLEDGVYVGEEETPYLQVPFETHILHKNMAGRYFIDLANSQFRFTGNCTTGGVIHFFYIKTTDEVEEDTSPVWPDRFHRIIPLRMAKLYWAIDQGDKSRAWDDRWAAEHDLILKRMVNWDAKLKEAAYKNSRIGRTDKYDQEII